MRDFEDFKVGDRFAFGRYRMDEAEMLDYARRYDPQPIHVDPEAAASSIYGGLIASGILTLAIVLRLMVDEFRDSAMLGSPGWDEIRWLLPVRAGDSLSIEVEITDTRASERRPEIGIIRGQVTARNQTGAAVLTAIPTWFVGRRPVKAGSETSGDTERVAASAETGT